MNKNVTQPKILIKKPKPQLTLRVGMWTRIVLSPGCFNVNRREGAGETGRRQYPHALLIGDRTHLPHSPLSGREERVWQTALRVQCPLRE